jgi:hypothetical protein
VAVAVGILVEVEQEVIELLLVVVLFLHYQLQQQAIPLQSAAGDLLELELLIQQVIMVTQVLFQQ